MNLIDVAKQFATPETCNDFLESMRWQGGVECVRCNSKRVSKYVRQASTRQRLSAKTGQMETKVVPARILYICLSCKRQFSVTEGTIFNGTHLSLEKWYMATALMINVKKGISALQLKRDIGVAYKTAWYLSHRIRKAMGLIEMADENQLDGTVEVDETYMGSKKYDRRCKRIPKVPREEFEAVIKALLKTPPMPAGAIEGKRSRKADAKRPGPQKRW
jgi:DNA-directed RNA polymerase subunit RPC12/RpoP